LLLIATSEMLHLRWANQLLWELNGDNPGHSPALDIATLVPGLPRDKPDAGGKTASVGMNPPEMRPIGEAIGDFIAAESPSGTIEGQYAKVLALLRHGVPAHTVETGPGQTEHHGRRDFSPELIGLVERVMADGVTHYSRFREIKALLDRPHAQPLVRKLRHLEDGETLRVTPVSGNPQMINHATFVRLYEEIISALDDAYSAGRVEDRDYIIRARQAMMEIDVLATQFASQGVAVPLLSIGASAIANFHHAKSRKP